MKFAKLLPYPMDHLNSGWIPHASCWGWETQQSPLQIQTKKHQDWWTLTFWCHHMDYYHLLDCCAGTGVRCWFWICQETHTFLFQSTFFTVLHKRFLNVFKITSFGLNCPNITSLGKRVFIHKQFIMFYVYTFIF